MNNGCRAFTTLLEKFHCYFNIHTKNSLMTEWIRVWGCKVCVCVLEVLQTDSSFPFSATVMRYIYIYIIRFGIVCNHKKAIPNISMMQSNAVCCIDFWLFHGCLYQFNGFGNVYASWTTKMSLHTYGFIYLRFCFCFLWESTFIH